MIRNLKLLGEFEKQLIVKTPPNHFQSLKIAEALYEEACLLRIFSLKNPLDGIEVDIRLAGVLNSVQGTDEKDSDCS